MDTQVIGLRHSSNLDLLRTVAVLCVLIGHLVKTLQPNRAVAAFEDLARFGVVLFFVHTSFVLMHSLSRHENGARRRHAIASFYLRRIFRIYPLAIFCVLVTLVFHIPELPWAHWHAPARADIVSSFLLVQNLAGANSVVGPLWSLPLEVQMYAVLPFLYWFALRTSVRGVAFAWAAAAIIGLAQMHYAAHFGLWRLSIAQFGPCFFAGILSYRLSLRWPARLTARLWPFALIAMVAAYLAWQHFGSGATVSEHFPPYREWICALAVGLFIPLCHDSKARSLNRCAAAIAKYSYGIYLFQIAALWVAFAVLTRLPLPLQFSVFLALIVALPVAVFHVIEQPMMRAGIVFASRIVRSVTSATPAEPVGVPKVLSARA